MDVVLHGFNPTIHGPAVISLFRQRPDIFSDQEVSQVSMEVKNPSTPVHEHIIAIDGGKVVGYAAVKYYFDRNAWYLHRLVVDKSFQNKGLATDILKEAESRLKMRNVNHLFVDTCSCSGEMSTRAFYAKNGFIPLKTQTDDRKKGHSKVTFTKRI